jgi:hypothetical protein
VISGAVLFFWREEIGMANQETKEAIDKADPAGVEFREWVATLPKKHWAQYDLAACRLGWDAAKKLAEKENQLKWEEYFE